MKDIVLTELKTISHPKGDLYHALKKSETSFMNFGEVYFTSVKLNEIKGWKKHLKMNLNLVVINGEVRFVVYNEDNKKFSEFRLSRNKNYKRLSIPAGHWVAFQGCEASENLLMNFADIEHEPSEALNKDIKEIPYEW